MKQSLAPLASVQERVCPIIPPSAGCRQQVHAAWATAVWSRVGVGGTCDDQGKYDPKFDKPQNTWVTRSTDGGKTWSEAAAIDVSEFGWGSPFGKIVTLPDGAMLMAI